MEEEQLEKLRLYFRMLIDLSDEGDKLIEIGELGLKLIERYETYENMDWPSEDW